MVADIDLTLTFAGHVNILHEMYYNVLHLQIHKHTEQKHTYTHTHTPAPQHHIIDDIEMRKGTDEQFRCWKSALTTVIFVVLSHVHDLNIS